MLWLYSSLSAFNHDLCLLEGHRSSWHGWHLQLLMLKLSHLHLFGPSRSHQACCWSRFQYFNSYRPSGLIFDFLIEKAGAQRLRRRHPFKTFGQIGEYHLIRFIFDWNGAGAPHLRLHCHDIRPRSDAWHMYRAGRTIGCSQIYHQNDAAPHLESVEFVFGAC